MHNSKKILAILLAVVMVFCLTGCMASIQNIEIKPDLSGTVTIRAGYTKEAIDAFSEMDESGDNIDLSVLKPFEYGGVTYYGDSQVIEFKDLAVLNESLYRSMKTDDSAFSGNNSEVLSNIIFSPTEDGAIEVSFKLQPRDSMDSEMTAEEGNEFAAAIAEGFADTMESAFGDLTSGEDAYQLPVIVYEIEFPAEIRQVSGGSDGVTISGNRLTFDVAAAQASLTPTSTLKYAFSTAPSVSSSLPSYYFPDVNAAEWYYIAVCSMANAGVVNGKDNGTFAPADKITYAQLCQMIAKAKSMDYGMENGFWGSKAVKSCVTEGYIEDRGAVNAANYDVPITREAAIAAVVRAFGNNEDSGEKTLSMWISEDEIPDFEKISEAYQEDILDAYDLGITHGTDANGTFNPTAQLTRAEICQLFFNLPD